MSNTRRVTSGGFTLVELMVTLGIVAALALLAIPGVESFKRNAELSSLSNTLLASLNAARGEAMKRGVPAFIVPANNAADWNTGWTVFVDNGSGTPRDQAYTAGDDLLVSAQPAPRSYFTITANGTAGENPAYIMFDGMGYSRTKAYAFGALTLSITRNDLSGDEQLKETRRLIVASSGRVRVCRAYDPATKAESTSCKATTVE